MKIITREYLNELIEYIGTPDIKVITGIRRSGKSKLLESFVEYILKNYSDVNIIQIDFYKLEFEELQEYHKLYNYIVSRYEENKRNFVIIDEVQLCKNFEKTINNLYTDGKYDIYISIKSFITFYKYIQIRNCYSIIYDVYTK